jgi:uncharacterized protein
MEIRPVERLILIMLSEIYEKVGCEGVNAKFVREALYDGHDWAFEWQFQGLFPEPVEERIAVEVCDILDMWRIIEEVSDEKFPGFDSNREGRHASVARFFTDEMGRFEWFKGRVDQGVVQLDGYRRMYQVFKDIRPNLGNRKLNSEELNQLMQARLHPDYR